MVKIGDISITERELFKKVILHELAMKPVLCKFALELLNDIPKWFWVESASGSGKYHPEYAAGDGGLARHSLMTYRWLMSLMEANEIDLSEYLPAMIFATLFHDCGKRGSDDIPAPSMIFEHPLIAAKIVIDNAEKFVKDNKEFIEMTADDEESFKSDIAVAVSCIESHMGRWNTNKDSDVTLPKPKTSLQYMVHMADYCASRKFTEFDEGFFAKICRLEN